MQQTEKYKLDLIETTDPFSPDALNANTRQVEEVLARADGELAALDQRVIKLENCRIMMGNYIGDNEADRLIDLGERPAAVVVASLCAGGSRVTFVYGDFMAVGSRATDLKIVDNGFVVNYTLLNNNRDRFCFIAFFGDWPAVNIPSPNVS